MPSGEAKVQRTHAMEADELHGEIEPVPDARVTAPRLVDRHLLVDSVPREDHHAADGVAERPERLVVYLGEVVDVRRLVFPVNVCIIVSLDNENSPRPDTWYR